MARWFVDRQPQQGIPSVSLRRLLPEARFVGCEDFEVSGCTADSRRLDPGQVFVAVRGERHDGHAFVGQAIERGAAGVVVERPVPEAGRLQVVVPDSRAALARLCQALAGDPSEQMLTLGVTGACGRTVTALFLRAIFEAAGRPVRAGRPARTGPTAPRPGPPARGCPGPRAWRGCSRRWSTAAAPGPSSNSTPRRSRRRRVEGVSLDAAVVTDVGAAPGATPDAVVARRAAMARLFRQVVPGGAAVVNADDPHAELLGAVNLDARRVAFGLNADGRRHRAGRPARPRRARGSGSAGSTARRPSRCGWSALSSVSHALAAAAVAWSRGVGRRRGRRRPGVGHGRRRAGSTRSTRARGSTSGSTRRATRPSCTRRWLPPRPTRAGRVHCVFGAEGLREGARAGRLALAAAAEAAGRPRRRSPPTTRGPRTPTRSSTTSSPASRHPGRVRVEPDRRLAIEAALADAEPGDAVLIAGKGRQTFQILADRAVPFDDAAVARDWLRASRPGRGGRRRDGRSIAMRSTR